MNSVGRYEICGRLGRGGMSAVYKARAPVTGRIVALKILKPRDEIFEDLVGWEKLRELFIEEAKIMGNLSHDHIAKVIDCDSHEDVPFIVLEYFSHSIGEFIGEAYNVEQQTRKISITRTFMYIRQALKGLERLHFAGVIHRDIKPYNMMITNDDRVKLIDFGLSRVRGEETLAIPGMQVGSPYYAAPEQGADPTQADGRADLFSLGVLMYRMLTGRLLEHSQGELLAASDYNQELTPQWDSFLLKALKKRPEQRFANALEMRAALEEVFNRWQKQSADKCPVNPPAEQRHLRVTKPLRAEPQRVMYRDIRDHLGLDELFRPRAFNQHQMEVVTGHLLYDPLTKLYWQRCGSGFTLGWEQAKDYIKLLNDESFQDKSTWRLPTTAELATILRSPSMVRDVCLDPNFDPTLHWLWSSDHCTKKQAWMADIVESYIGRLDIEGTASVCAVSS